MVDIQEDGDPYWFNNPQYRLSADENVEVGRFTLSSKSVVLKDVTGGTRYQPLQHPLFQVNLMEELRRFYCVIYALVTRRCTSA